jgi:hypothetical protein
MNFTKDFDKLMKDVRILYLITFLAVANVISYLYLGNWDSIIFFLATGFLVSFFTKNMSYILASAILLTNLFYASNIQNKQVEGMKNKDKKEKKAKDSTGDLDIDVNVTSKPSVDENEEATLDEEDGDDEPTGLTSVDAAKSKIDKNSTLEDAYDNLDSLLSDDEMNKLSDKTDKLAKHQKKVFKIAENMAPMMSQMKDWMKMFEGSSIKDLTKMVGPLTKSL